MNPENHRGWTGVRYREDVGFELRCERCMVNGGARYWPLTLEFWDPRHGMRYCRACLRAMDRIEERARRRGNPELARARDRQRYRRNRRQVLLKRKAYYEENYEAIRAKAKERYQRRIA